MNLKTAKLLLLSSAVLVLVAGCGGEDPLTPQEVYSKYDPAVVLVMTEGGHGTGTLIEGGVRA